MTHWLKRPDVVAFIERNRCCEVCGGSYGLIPHHKFCKARWRVYPGMSVHEVSNLCMVCQDCHKAWDSTMRQTPSPMASKAHYHAANFAKLLRLWPGRKWERMAPQFILDAVERHQHEDE